MTTPRASPAADAPPRLTFRHWRPFHPADPFAVYVEVTERLSKKKSVAFTYAVKVLPDLPVCRVFHFYKQGQTESPRELRVYADGHSCTCESGKYRPGRPCRHLSAAQYLTEQGVI